LPLKTPYPAVAARIGSIMRGLPRGASLVVFVVVSLLTPRTPEDLLRAWSERLAGSAAPSDDEGEVALSTSAPSAPEK